MKSSNETEKNVVDLASFKKKKETQGEFARGREPLYVSHLEGKVTGSPNAKKQDGEGFGDRLTRIRSSLEKINRLMADLKRMSAEGPTPVDAKSSSPSHTTKK
jgi:hypothetical protein